MRVFYVRSRWVSSEYCVNPQHMGTVNDYDFRKSCTIIINEKPVCIHDESWKECEVSML